MSVLMAARRAVGAALRSGDKGGEQSARRRVQDAKLALGERGRAWWLPADPATLDLRLAAAMRTLLRHRAAASSICPSDAARVVDGNDWRKLMPQARAVAWRLADEGWLEVVQRGKPVAKGVSGPVRLRRCHP